MVNRSVRYHPSTAMSHANDMISLLKETVEKFVVLIVDGGSDCTRGHLLPYTQFVYVCNPFSHYPDNPLVLYKFRIISYTKSIYKLNLLTV